MAGSPAKTCPTPAREPVWLGHVPAFGGSTSEPFAEFDPDSLSWRTFQLSLLEDWTSFSGTWPRAGMTRSGTAFRRQPSAPLTVVTGSSLLHTPTAKANQSSPSMATRDRGSWFRDLWPTPTVVDMGRNKTLDEWDEWTGKMRDAHGNGNGHGRSLDVEVRRSLWATPTAHPRTHSPRQVDHGAQLANQVAAAGTPGTLNPTWVEWLMGFPLGWTDCEPSETPSSPRSPRSSAVG